MVWHVWRVANPPPPLPRTISSSFSSHLPGLLGIRQYFPIVTEEGGGCGGDCLAPWLLALAYQLEQDRLHLVANRLAMLVLIMRRRAKADLAFNFQQIRRFSLDELVFHRFAFISGINLSCCWPYRKYHISCQLTTTGRSPIVLLTSQPSERLMKSCLRACFWGHLTVSPDEPKVPVWYHFPCFQFAMLNSTTFRFDFDIEVKKGNLQFKFWKIIKLCFSFRQHLWDTSFGAK